MAAVMEAEVIDLTGPDAVVTSFSTFPSSPGVAGPSRLAAVQSANARARKDPITISDDESSGGNSGYPAQRKEDKSRRTRTEGGSYGMGSRGEDDERGVVKGSPGKARERLSKSGGGKSKHSLSDNDDAERSHAKRRDHDATRHVNGREHTTEKKSRRDASDDEHAAAKRREKKERSKARKEAKREAKHAEREADDLFRADIFVLDYGTERPAPQHVDAAPESQNAQKSPPRDPDNLILPSHVSVDSGPATVLPVTNEISNDEESDEDFIQYLDFDDVQRGATRYFDEGKSEKQTTYSCKRCGAEGDHKTIDCPVVICLTCGARNDHITRGCPISKTCFACGIKGHVSKDCPNRYGSHFVMKKDRMHDCQRCGSDLHTAKECPTLWRMYDYVSDSQREGILDNRRAREGLPFGQGGEGYIGENLWCYNCGGEGHLGDDCTGARRPFDFPREPSAFGRFNTLSGPFADSVAPKSTRSRKQREWEVEGNFDDGYGFSGPSDVGKRGRDKEKERMRRRAQEARAREDDDDADDWFGNREGRRPDSQSILSHPPPLGPKRSKDKAPPLSAPRGMRDSKPSFSLDFQPGARSSPGKKTNLSDRIEGFSRKDKSTPSGNEKGQHEHRSRHGPGHGHGESKKDRERHREKKRDREKDRHRHRSEGDTKRRRREGDKDGRDGKSDSKSTRKYFGGYVA